MKCELGYLFPELSYIAEVIICIPSSNAWPERGASRLKLNKTKLRSSMKNDMLNAVLNIQINGPELFTHECDDLILRSINAWKKCRSRRKIGTVKLVLTLPPKAVLADSSSQTEDENLTAELEEAEATQTCLAVSLFPGYHADTN